MQTRLNILAVGSPIDADIIAWDVARAFNGTYQKQTNHPIVIEYLDRPSAGLIEKFSSLKLVWILDGLITTTKEPGEISIFEASDFLNTPSTCSSHDWGVSQSIQMAKKLDCLPSTLLVLGICLNTEKRTSEYNHVVRRAVNNLSTLIATHLH